MHQRLQFRVEIILLVFIFSIPLPHSHFKFCEDAISRPFIQSTCNTSVTWKLWSIVVLCLHVLLISMIIWLNLIFKSKKKFNAVTTSGEPCLNSSLAVCFIDNVIKHIKFIQCIQGFSIPTSSKIQMVNHVTIQEEQSDLEPLKIKIFILANSTVFPSLAKSFDFAWC